MWWPIRYQWLVPFGSILIVAVAFTSVSSAWLAAKHNTAVTLEQVNRVIETLAGFRYPFSANVLQQMHGLSGAEFAAFDAAGSIQASTLPKDVFSGDLLADIDQRGHLQSLAENSLIALNGQRYFASVITPLNDSSRADLLLVLYPESRWAEARADAILPPLFVGGATLSLMVIVSAWLAGRMSRRIERMKQQVAAIADGDFTQLPLDNRRDELQQLSLSVNQMSRQLRDMRETIRQTERTRLLGQLAGGLAHQLRNAITGARMAVQIHAKRCGSPNDDSLTVALRQLELTEEQIRGLLSLGKPEHRTPVPRAANSLVEEIVMLLGPVCKHSGVSIAHETLFEPGATPENSLIADSEQIRTAVLNLVLNAIEAAGPNGQVELRGLCGPSQIVFEVFDTGSGPPPELGESMFELFITGKPEGVGFGLALARQVAEEHQGTLTWSREHERTCFRMILPNDIPPKPSTQSV